MGKARSLKDFTSKKNRVHTLCAGTFDILHAGHLEHLSFAARVGRPLCVVVKGDKDVSKRKGDVRPYVGEKERARLISLLPFVDYVCITNYYSNADRVLETIKPRKVVYHEEQKDDEKLKRAMQRFPRITFVCDTQKRVTSSSVIIKNIQTKKENLQEKPK